MYKIISDINAYFKTNWPGDIQYDATAKQPSGEEWILLEVEPVWVSSIGYAGCTDDAYSIQVTVYARNPTQSARLADEVITFLKNKKISEQYVGSWRPVSQGLIQEGCHFRKINFPISELN